LIDEKLTPSIKNQKLSPSIKNQKSKIKNQKSKIVPINQKSKIKNQKSNDLRRQKEYLERLSEGNPRRSFFLCAKLHPAEFFSGIGSYISADTAG